MDPTVVAAIIGAAAAIVAAVVGARWAGSRGKNDRVAKITMYQFFVLGSNLCQVGWVKAVPGADDQQARTLTSGLIERLSPPVAIQRQLQQFLRSGGGAESGSNFDSLMAELMRIKKLLGQHILVEFGREEATHYDFGFQISMAIVTLDVAPMMMPQTASVASTVAELGKLATYMRDVGLPERDLQRSIDRATEAARTNDAAAFVRAKEDFMSAVDSIDTRLHGRK